jgi:hypothetical protein
MVVDWLFICEAVDFGPYGEVTSMHRILRAHTGFGAPRVPFEVRPCFVFSVRGEPGERAEIEVWYEVDGKRESRTRDPLVMPATGTAEVVSDIGPMIFVQPCVLTLSLVLAGEVISQTALAFDGQPQ